MIFVKENNAGLQVIVTLVGQRSGVGEIHIEHDKKGFKVRLIPQEGIREQTKLVAPKKVGQEYQAIFKYIEEDSWISEDTELG